MAPHLALFNLFPIWGEVKERIPVATRNAWTTSPKSPRMDFLKMDVQGGERDVLAHGRTKLKRMPWRCRRKFPLFTLYHQPARLSVRLDTGAARNLGFLPHCCHAEHKDLAALAHGGCATNPTGAFANCWKPIMVYVRDFSQGGEYERRNNGSTSPWWRTIATARYDLAAALPSPHADRNWARCPAGSNQRYLSSLNSSSLEQKTKLMLKNIVHSRRPRTQSQEYRRGDSARYPDGADRAVGFGQVEPGFRHHLC